MLCEKNDSQSYIRDFQKRFNNFAEKAPILISYSISPEGVSVIDEGKNTVYKFDWDYTIPVKSFIHGIKEVLSEKAYPIIGQTIEKHIPLTDEQVVKLMEKGIEASKIPETVIQKTSTKYLIDKVIVFKDIFILKNLNTGELYRYKLNKSSVFFLKKLRAEKMDIHEAGNYFFNNSVLLNKIETRDEDGSTG